MKKLGNVLYPEQYAEVGEEVRISSSVEALEFFEAFYKKGGLVLLGTMFFKSETIKDTTCWLYFDIKSKVPELISTIPVFNIPMDELNDLEITNIVPHAEEIYMVHEGVLYSSAYTDTGELCIKKVRMILNSNDATSIVGLYSGLEVEEIYPVELYSHSAHKFVCVCWAVKTVGASFIAWHPASLEDELTLKEYPNEDLEDHFIEVGETAVINGESFKLEKNKQGLAFRKLSDGKKLAKLFKKSFALRQP